MKKRLRKKLRVGEFFAPFLEVTAEGNPNVTKEMWDKFFDDIFDFVEELDIGFGGGVCSAIYYTMDYRKPMTKDSRQIIFDFYNRKHEDGIIKKFYISELVDNDAKYKQWEKDN